MSKAWSALANSWSKPGVALKLEPGQNEKGGTLEKHRVKTLGTAYATRQRAL